MVGAQGARAVGMLDVEPLRVAPAGPRHRGVAGAVGGARARNKKGVVCVATEGRVCPAEDRRSFSLNQNFVLLVVNFSTLLSRLDRHPLARNLMSKDDELSRLDRHPLAKNLMSKDDEDCGVLISTDFLSSNVVLNGSNPCALHYQNRRHQSTMNTKHDLKNLRSLW